MKLSQLKAEYVEIRDLAEGAKDRYIETKDMYYYRMARFFRGLARETQRKIRKIEDRILVK